MMPLILFEGERYSQEDFRRLMPEAETDLSNQVISRLIDWPLESTRLPLTPPSEDGDADNEMEGTAGTTLALRLPLGGIQIRHLVGSGALQIGQISLPVEVLPKMGNRDEPDVSRAALLRMWGYACDLNLREDPQPAAMALAKQPLHEWLIQRFLEQLDRLLARGIRAHYVEHEDNLLTVRGRLSVRDNLRLNALTPHRFYCRYEEFSPDRPENRLIRKALAVVQARSAFPANRRRAASLAEWMHEIPPSTHISRDFSLWRTDRLMTHYLEIRSTCEWILKSQSPSPVAGKNAMFGRFVRMNDVFERYVANWMAEQPLQAGGVYRVYDQRTGPAASRRLCGPGAAGHSMRPDIRVYDKDKRCVAILDAKWKKPRTDQKLASREDFYQMYAYARHWLTPGDESDKTEKLIGLVYPSLDENDRSLEFKYDDLSQIKGMALKFLLPQRQGNGSWREGFLPVTGDADRFPFLPAPPNRPDSS